jgi:urease accessory protein
MAAYAGRPDRPRDILDMGEAAFVRVRTVSTHDPHGAAIVVELPMTASDRRRVRRIVEAPDGTRLALELPTGTVLHPGQVLHRDGERAYLVSAAPEEVLAIAPRTVMEGARVGHLIGNLHREIEVDGDEVFALADEALADRLARAGVPFTRRLRAFQGRSPAEHAH